MTWLLTNDDGVFAPGIVSLFQAIEHDRLLVVAPQSHQSGCSHQVTTAQPLNLQKIQTEPWCNLAQGHPVYAVTGTPVDCVRVGHCYLNQELSFVLSGINDGANLGTDIYISGTVAAVREAAILGIPGIALSQYRKRAVPIRWEVAMRWTKRVLVELMERSLPAHSFWNVNFPSPDDAAPEPDIIFCPTSRKPLPIKFKQKGQSLYYAGEYANRDREPGSDVDICFSGQIAVTQISLS